MKKLLVLLIVSLLFSPAIAHTGEHDTDINQSEPSSLENQGKQSGFSQLYPEYRSGSIWVIAEILVVTGATALAVRHYIGKSKYGSLKEFIRQRVV